MELSKNKKIILFVFVVIITAVITYFITKKSLTIREDMTNVTIGGQTINIRDQIRAIYGDTIGTNFANLQNLAATVNNIQTQITNGTVTLPSNLTVTGNINASSSLNAPICQITRSDENGPELVLYNPSKTTNGTYWKIRNGRDSGDHLSFESFNSDNQNRTLRFRLNDNGTNNMWGNLNVNGDINITNGNLRINDNILIPRGVIVAWNSTTPPAGWLLCNGTNGTPDLRSRFILGSGQGSNLSNRTHGATGGAETVTLTIAQMPAHSHTYDRTHWPSSQRFDDWTFHNIPIPSHQSVETSTTGGGQPHENMPPFMVLTFIMKQ